MVWRPPVQAWAITAGLVVAAAGSLVAAAATGLPTAVVFAVAAFVVGLAVLSWRSGGRFEFDHRGARPYQTGDPPVIRDALLSVCERTGDDLPLLLLTKMDVPGAIVGYDDGEPLIAVDPRLTYVLDRQGLEAILAHELAHLHVDLHTDALRKYLPQVIGGSTLWVVVLSWQPSGVAVAGGLAYAALALSTDRRVAYVRFGLSLGAEALALAASRYANRLEEYSADKLAVRAVSAEAMATALFEIAAVATGRNDEDVAGPIPWDADRTWQQRLFATHPAIESRATALGCPVPDWALPYHPEHRV